MAHHISDAVRRCIDECQSCRDICLEAISHCLDKGGKHVDATHMRTLLDCADACETSATFMLRGSAMHSSTCEVCAEACEQCAKSCDRLGDDDLMRRCAEECRRCAESCRQMATMKA
jgi:hypothetical protein